MNSLMTIGRKSGAALAVLMFVALPLASAQAADWGTYYPEYDSTFYPEYDSTFYPEYDSTFYPEYDSTFYPEYDSTFYPEYDSTFYPEYDSTYYPEYDSTFYPEYDSTYYPEYDVTYYPEYDFDYNNYSNSSAYASAYASSYSNSYTFNYDNDRDRGCKKNCNPPKPKPKPVCSLDISPSRVDFGDDATIFWTSENATSATLTSFGSVSTGGSRDIENIKFDKTYTLTVSGPGGTATCSDSVEVDEEEEDDLECKLKVSDSSIRRGDSVRVTWSSDGADYGRISPEIGRVDEEGSESIRLYEDTTFKGTFYNDHDEVTCRVSVDVDHDVYIPPQTPYVTLSAVPYTGFELGPVGTAIYWSLLVLWCLIAAYLIAVKKAHVSLARRLNNFLFGSSEVVVTPAPTVVAQAQAPAHKARPQHFDMTDEFVLSQLNRGRHAH